MNVGDSVGSTLTQYTFVLGLFPLIVAVLAIDRHQVGLVSILTMAGLGLTTQFVGDGWLGRWEEAVLVLAWGPLRSSSCERFPATLRTTRLQSATAASSCRWGSSS